MAVTTTTYSSNTSITCSVASLASSSTFVAGQESNEVDNTTNKYLDALVKARITVGTTPTANTTINVYVWGADVSLATTAIDVLDGTDSNETLTNTGILYALRPLAQIQVSAATSNVTYEMLPSSVASRFGGIMPKFWGLYVSHNTGAALNSTAGNHSFEYVGITFTTA